MDTPIVVAVAGGVFAVLGTIIKFVGELASNTAQAELTREGQVDANLWKLVDELKLDREHAKDELSKTRNDHVALQGMYQGALHRIEFLEIGREKDQAMILELQAKVRQLEEASKL